MTKRKFLILLIGLFAISIASAQEAIEKIYFVSGLYQKNELNEKAFKALTEEIKEEKNPLKVVFLGDYHSEKPNSDDEYMEYLKDLPEERHIQYVFIPGYNEWERDKYRPEKTILKLNKEIGEQLKEEQYLLAANACPGPYTIEMEPNLLLILINDYWLINDFEVPKIEKGCRYPRKLDFLLELEETIHQNRDKRIILAGINPLESAGPKGGKFKLKHHLFPWNIKNPKNYIPLPLFGTFYILYRKILGNPDDLSNIKSSYFRKYLKKILSNSPNAIYVSAHENHLDFRELDGFSQIICGSLNGAKYSKEKKSLFTSIKPGYSKLEIQSDGKVSASFRSNSEEIFRKEVFGASQKKEHSKTNQLPDYSGETISAKADPELVRAGKKRPGLSGLNYRKEWSASLSNIPVFNWGKEYGGLKIVKKGGGMQTRSLRLENPEAYQYVLRSIKKYPENAIPLEIRGTIYAELVNDQISASHPYAAFAIPKLADAAGVFHTNPKLVYLNEDPRLGQYSNDFEKGLYLFEERPDDERRDVESFGSPRDIESTPDIIEKSQKSGKHQVDQKWVVKSRLFDMWIGDWDRHDDQWRWAEFKKDDDHKIYRPIPRDRDQAFFYSDGLLLNLASRKWGIPKFQGFDYEIRDVNGLSYNARYFDRFFMTEPDLEDWLASADSLQNALTDEVIEAGIKDLPPEIYAINGEKIIAKLKKRREDLKDYARDYYTFLSKEVNVLGTNKANRFDVERLENGNTSVKVYEVAKNSRKVKYKLYEREFEKDITKEIRLYGLKGKDQFNINGEVKKGIKIRIIGGGGKDKIEDQSKVKGPGKKTIVYDKKKSTELKSSSETKSKISNAEGVNDYDRNAFKYNKLMPFLYVNYNPDDGVFLGGGPIFITHGFRKEPFKSSHKLLANVAPKSANYNVNYEGVFTDVFGKLDAQIDALISVPSFSTFYYGIGNNSILSEERLENDNQYYRVRFDTEVLKLSLKSDSRNEKHRLAFGANYLRANIESDVNEDEDDDPRFIVDLSSDSLHQNLFDDHRFVGGHLEYSFDSRDNSRMPERGLYFKSSATYLHDVIESSLNSVQIDAEQSLYFTLSHRFKTILAARLGASGILGDYPFFLAPSIGGLSKIRGFRRNRFRGDYSVYQNTELRIRLFSLRSEFIIGDFGILGFHDIGRVWADQPSVLSGVYSAEEINQYSNEDQWHQGIGFGLWIAPFNMAVLSADYSFGNNGESILFLRLGYMF